MSSTRNRWLIVAVICIPVFVGSLDLTVVSAFLPELIVDLNINPLTGLDDTAWILTGYLLAYTISLTFMGRLSDLIGRRWVYAISLLIFIGGSVLVATAHQYPTDLMENLQRRMGERPLTTHVTLQVIIIGRVIQAFGAGALVPVSMALVADLFPVGKRAQALGLVAAVDTLGWVLGHLYGGLFLQIPNMPWQGLFWVNVPLTLFALTVTLWALRNIPMQRVTGRFDILGAVLIAVALSCLNIGLGANIDVSGAQSFDQLSQLPPYALPLLLGGVFLLLLFVLVESYIRDPLINPRLFRRRNIAFGSLTNFFVGYCLFIGLVSVPILVNVTLDDLDTGLRDAALRVGLLLSALTVPMAIATIPGGWLASRYSYRPPMVGGLLIAAFGFMLIWQTWTIDVETPVIVIEMAIVGIGIGLTFSPVSAALIDSAKDSERGVVSALVLILRLIGMTISVSSLTTFALNRVSYLASQQEGSNVDILNAAFDTFPAITVDVLAEFGLIGMVLCLLAILPAWFVRDVPSSA
ncbi:MAG: MFS transporter [Phototrophicales bacterium]